MSRRVRKATSNSTVIPTVEHQIDDAEIARQQAAVERLAGMAPDDPEIAREIADRIVEQAPPPDLDTSAGASPALRLVYDQSEVVPPSGYHNAVAAISEESTLSTLWRAIDGGAELRTHAHFGVTLWDRATGELVYPAEDPGLSTLVTEAMEAVMRQKPPQKGFAPVEAWTAEWPSAEGVYWFFGHRPQDNPARKPRLSIAIAIVDSNGVLHVSSDGTRLPVDRTRGAWLPVALPASLPIALQAQLPQSAPLDPTHYTHIIHGGSMLCGMAPSPNIRSVRTRKAKDATCPTCLASIEASGQRAV